MSNLFEGKMRKALRAIQDLGNAQDEYYSLLRKKPHERTDNHQELVTAARKKMDDLSDRITRGRQQQEYKMVRNEVLGKQDEVGEEEGTATSRLHALNADIINTFAGGLTSRKKIAGIPKDINIPGKAEEYGIKLHGDVRRNRELIAPLVKHMEVTNPLETPRMIDATKSMTSNYAFGTPMSGYHKIITDRMISIARNNQEDLLKVNDAMSRTPALVDKYANMIKAVQRSELNTNLSKAGMSPEKFAAPERLRYVAPKQRNSNGGSSSL